jgi:hypothetical protein
MKITSFLGSSCLLAVLVLAGTFAVGWFAGRARGRREGRAEALAQLADRTDQEPDER